VASRPRLDHRPDHRRFHHRQLGWRWVFYSTSRRVIARAAGVLPFVRTQVRGATSIRRRRMLAWSDANPAPLPTPQLMGGLDGRRSFTDGASRCHSFILSRCAEGADHPMDLFKNRASPSR